MCSMLNRFFVDMWFAMAACLANKIFTGIASCYSAGPV